MLFISYPDSDSAVDFMNLQRVTKVRNIINRGHSTFTTPKVMLHWKGSKLLQAFMSGVVNSVSFQRH